MPRFLLLFACCPAILFASLLAAADWPQWRGPNRDAISRETGLLDSWPEDGPPLAWQAEGLGSGYASVAVAGGRIYTLGDVSGGCHAIALNESDGKIIWKTKIGGGDPNCTPTVDGDLVFGLTKDGELACLKTADGELVWRLSFKDDLGGRMMSGWGYSESPLIDGDRLICTPGADDALLAALDKRTGKVIWKSAAPKDFGRRGGDGAAYSSIVVSRAAGVKQYVQLVGRGIVSVDAETGRVLWTYNDIANGTANIPTPLVKDNYVFCSTGYGAGAALLEIKKSGRSLVAEEKYFISGDTLQNHHGGMILLGDYVYFGNKHDNGFPICVELATGKIMWEPGRGPGSGSAAIAYADGDLYFRYQNGVMALIEATPEEYHLKGEFKLASVRGQSWPHPVIAGGRLYLRDQDVLMCYDVRAR